MNPKNHLQITLEQIAQRDIPDNTNLWPQIAARLSPKHKTILKTNMRLTLIVALVLLGLILATTAAYALYHYFSDPGLRFVGEAGLIEELSVTAQPTLLATPTALEPAMQIEEERNVEGISVSLDWVYLEDARQTIGFIVKGLTTEMEVGMPELSFGALTPEQVRGEGLSLQDSPEGKQGVYVIYQIVREPNFDGITEGHANTSIDIPIRDKDGKTLKEFHFEVLEAPIHLGPSGGTNTFASRSMSVEMHLRQVRFTAQETQAQLCHVSLDGKNWEIHSASIQMAEEVEDVVNVPEVRGQRASNMFTVNDERCMHITFPVGSQRAIVMRLSVDPLIGSNGETLNGDWSFVWAELPGNIRIPGIASTVPAAPLATQIVGEMTATLLQAYADANRLAFVVHVAGLPEGHMLYNVTVLDASGDEINAGFSSSESESEPGTFSLVFTPVDSLPETHFAGQLLIGVSPAPGESATTSFRFDMDIPVYPAIVLQPRQIVVANGVEMLLDMIKITPSFSQAYLCYQKPTKDDWMIGGSSYLQIGTDQSSMDNYQLAFDTHMGNIVKGSDLDWEIPANYERCVVVGYPVGHHNQPEALTLTVSELERSFPELIPEDQLQMAREKLLHEGIEMDWVVSFGSGGGGGGPVITRKPAGMTEEQVMRRFFELLGYYFPGPWNFVVQVVP